MTELALQPAGDAQTPRAQAGWRAELELEFECRAGQSVLSRKRQRGPLTVQRAFYPEGPDVAHLYVLHPPGGVVAGDKLEIRAQVASGARALITTPAATKYYKSQGQSARQETRLSVAAGASLEWLPQESIVFGASDVSLSTRVELEPGALFCGWELSCLGRPASGDTFAAGRLEQRFEIWQAERPLRIERCRIEAHGATHLAPWGLGGHSVFGTLLCAPAPAEWLSLVREQVQAEPGEYFSVSRPGEVLVCRYLGDSAERAKRAFCRAWSALRPALLARPACSPRIWLT